MKKAKDSGSIPFYSITKSFNNIPVGLQMISNIKGLTTKRNNLKVKFHFDRLHCHDEAGGWGNAEPYMWTVFFKMDGTTCRLNDSLLLEGTATIFFDSRQSW
ncbi:MAG: hypothetical protein NVV82_12870 [Sporocytophaga sp.]|nr:hypothetical protein [Sporocytophaga sp.]